MWTSYFMAYNKNKQLYVRPIFILQEWYVLALREVYSGT